MFPPCLYGKGDVGLHRAYIAPIWHLFEADLGAKNVSVYGDGISVLEFLPRYIQAMRAAEVPSLQGLPTLGQGFRVCWSSDSR